MSTRSTIVLDPLEAMALAHSFVRRAAGSFGNFESSLEGWSLWCRWFGLGGDHLRAEPELGHARLSGKLSVQVTMQAAHALFSPEMIRRAQERLQIVEAAQGLCVLFSHIEIREQRQP